MLHPSRQDCYNAAGSIRQEPAVYKCLAGLVTLALLAVSFIASAEVVKGLHAATVPVANQGETAMKAAAGDALAEVVVKVSGSRDVLQNPVIARALPGARSHVQQYVFARDDSQESGLTARFEFGAAYVNGLLTDAGLPLWTANRPRVLVWMAIERDGERQLVSSLESPELAAQLLSEFERRGVPARLPLYDLRDATAVSLEDVWGQRGSKIAAASARYGVEDILIGRAVAVSTGEWTGDWSYLSGAQRLDRSGNAAAATGFLQTGVNMVAEEMASRYAVAPSGTVADRIPMVVSGVLEFSDYTAIVNWLESLELIEHANLQHISGDRIELGLDAGAAAEQLATIIELNKRLQPVAAAPGELVYQWTN
jgi:hypothetical protein